MNICKLQLLILVAACSSFLGSNCAGPAGNGGIPINIFPPGELVKFGTRKSIPLTSLSGCGQPDGSQGISDGQGTVLEMGTLGGLGALANLSIDANAPSGTDSGALGNCVVTGPFTVSAPGNDTRVTGNIDATLSTNCILSNGANGYSVETTISLIDPNFSGNNTSQSQEFCYQVFSPGTSNEVVTCNDPITGISFINLTIRDQEFTVGETYSILVTFRVQVTSGLLVPELGGELACTLSVDDLTVCLEPGGCN